MLVFCYKLYLVQTAFQTHFVVLRITMFLDLVLCLAAMHKIQEPVIVIVMYLYQNPLEFNVLSCYQSFLILYFIFKNVSTQSQRLQCYGYCFEIMATLQQSEIFTYLCTFVLWYLYDVPWSIVELIYLCINCTRVLSSIYNMLHNIIVAFIFEAC